jgi:hypothetical protein
MTDPTTFYSGDPGDEQPEPQITEPETVINLVVDHDGTIHILKDKE